MQPIAHFLIALSAVAVYIAIRERTFPGRKLLFVVFIGNQFPDFIDKPLAHLLFVIPNGRMFAHSLVIAIPVSLGVGFALRRSEHLRAGVAFGVAYLSHIVADFGPQLLRSPTVIPANVVWPLLPVETRRVPSWAGPNSVNIILWSLFSLAMLLLTAALVVREIRE